MFRAVGRTEILEMPVLYGGHNLPPLVEIGLTDQPKIGGTMAPPAPLRQTEQQSRLTCGVLTDGSNVQTHPNFYCLMKKVDFVLSAFEWFQSVA